MPSFKIVGVAVCTVCILWMIDASLAPHEMVKRSARGRQTLPPRPTTTGTPQSVISRSIWAADSNRMSNADVQYNVYGHRLFTRVNEGQFTGTYQKLINLLRCYAPSKTNCTSEEDAFLDAILNTGPINILHGELSRRGLARSGKADFKRLLNQCWFQQYLRHGDFSSGFIHTFFGEIINGKVKGLHNWVQMYLEEKATRFQYNSHKGSLRPDVESISFRWNGALKPCSGVFMRTSPEVEIALYTLCFMTRIPGVDCIVDLAGNPIKITVFNFAAASNAIGTAFPVC